MPHTEKVELAVLCLLYQDGKRLDAVPVYC